MKESPGVGRRSARRLALAAALWAGIAWIPADVAPASGAGGPHEARGRLEGRVSWSGGPLPEWESVTDVVVYLLGGDLEDATHTPAVPAVLAQKDFTYVPHVLPIAVRAALTITNGDTALHNIHTYSKGRRRNPSFNRAQRAHTTLTTAFRAPDSLLVLCDIHPQMEAHIMVLPNPYFAKPDEKGAYTITEIPAGRYELVAWHPSYTSVRDTVEVEAGRTTRTDLVFAAQP
ncbi:MAG: carboxypeptidase regulatory-like domain-containing protein [Gemmatimonadota bacterium]